MKNTLLVSLALALLSIQVARSETVIVDFHSTFDGSPSQLQFSCRQDGRLVIAQPLRPTQHHTLYALTSAKLYTCGATWDKYVATFDGYSIARDGGNLRLSWKVDQTGWYLSYDNSNFVKEAGWVTP